MTLVGRFPLKLSFRMVVHGGRRILGRSHGSHCKTLLQKIITGGLCFPGIKKLEFYIYMEPLEHVSRCEVAAQDAKALGAAHFKAKRYDEAMVTYGKALAHCATLPPFATAAERAAVLIDPLEFKPLPWPQLELLAVACRSNRAQICINTDKNEQAVAECDAALAIYACSQKKQLYFKILIRKAKGLAAIGKEDAAREAAQLAESLGYALKGTWKLNGPDGKSAAPPPKQVESIIGHFVRKIVGKEPCTHGSPGKDLQHFIDTGVITHVDARDGTGESLLSILVSMPQRPKLPELEEDRGNAARRAAVSEMLQVLIENSADVNQREGRDRGCTPLMNCAKSWQADSVKQLIAAGANVSLRDRHGWTALMVANSGGGGGGGSGGGGRGTDILCCVCGLFFFVRVYGCLVRASVRVSACLHCVHEHAHTHSHIVFVYLKIN